MSHLVRFLMIEDDENHAELIRRNFENNGLSNPISHATDGKEALKRLKKEAPFENEERPDVILLDLNLPKISGHELLKIIKSDHNLKDIPVIILSTSGTQRDKDTAYANGANSYVVKPVGFDEFKTAIRELKLYWGVLNESPGK